MSNVFATTGTLVYVGPQVTSAIALASYEGLSLAFTAVAPVESIGKVGDESATIEFTSITDSRVRKAKGARNSGSIQLVCGWDALDSGQQALIAAEQTNKFYAFKLILPDASTDSGTDTRIYFRGLVNADPYNIGSANNVIKREYTILLDSALYEVAAT